MTTRNALIAGLLAIAAIGVYWISRPGAVLVDVATVVEQRFTAVVEEDGRTRVRDRFLVSAPLAGRVPRTALRAGDVVKIGQQLATITPNIAPLLDPRIRQELEERLGAAQAGVEEATALQERSNVLLDRARADLQRSTQLKERGVLSAAQFERDTTTFQSAERDAVAAQLRRHAAEHALEQARAAVGHSVETGKTERFVVTSPVDGKILRVVQESETVVPLGTPLLEVGDPGDLEVVVDVLTQDAARVQEGAKVLLESAGLEKVLEGRVRRVEPSGFTKVSALGVEEQRVWIVIDITSPREMWTKLGDGYRVGVQIVTDDIEKAVVVPIGALFRRGEAWQAFVVERGQSRVRSVTITRRSGRTAAISAGLRAGDKVVLYPTAALRDGTNVRLP
jgi:HlyD family secretion protein